MNITILFFLSKANTIKTIHIFLICDMVSNSFFS